MAVKTESQTTAGPARIDKRNMLIWGMLVLMLVAGWGLRLYCITDPPLEFHPQRQYWDANRARFMYYSVLKHFKDIPEWQLETAKANADISTEPPIVESLAVVGYLLTGGEHLAIPRGIVAACYVIGGLFLFLLALRIFSPFAAFSALAYYLFLPFDVISTRTFQPDPLMVMLLVAGLYYLYRYTEEQTTRRLLPAGIFTALALLAKPTSFFFIIIPFALLMLAKTVKETKGFKDRNALRQVLPLHHVAIFCGLVLLGLVWTIVNYLHGGGVAQQAAKTHMPELFHNPKWWAYYWLTIWHNALTYWALVFGLLGVIIEFVFWVQGLSNGRPRFIFWLLFGGWAGYALYFYGFNYHVQSHVYYNLPMVPILALSIAALVSAASGWILENVVARWLMIAAWLGYLAYLFFIKQPALALDPMMSAPNHPSPLAVLFFAPAAPFVALTLGMLVAVIAMQMRTRPKSIRPIAGFLAGMTLAALLIGAIDMIGKTQALAHPSLALQQKTLENIGQRVNHTRKAVFFTTGYGDPLKYHGLMGGNWWPTQADFLAERMRGEPAKTAAERLQGFINLGDEVFIIEWTQFGEFQQQPDLAKLLFENYPVIWAPPNPEATAPDENCYFVFDLRHPRQPLPVQ